MTIPTNGDLQEMLCLPLHYDVENPTSKTMTDFKIFNINYYVKFRLGEYVEKLQVLGFL